PQAGGARPEWMARLWKAPAAMAVRAVPEASGVGMGRKASVVPTPSWPWLLRPHARPVLSDFLIARLWAPPQAMAATAVPPSAGAGTRRLVVSPTPSWPELLRPHASTVSSERMARRWSQPA